MYRNESSIMQNKNQNKLNAAKIRHVYMIGLKIGNIVYMIGLKIVKAIAKIKKGMLKWFGHVDSMIMGRLTKKINMEEVSEKSK